MNITEIFNQISKCSIWIDIRSITRKSAQFIDTKQQEKDIYKAQIEKEKPMFNTRRIGFATLRKRRMSSER